MEKSEEYGALSVLVLYIIMFILALYGMIPELSENLPSYLMFLFILGYILWEIVGTIREKEEIV